MLELDCITMAMEHGLPLSSMPRSSPPPTGSNHHPKSPPDANAAWPGSSLNTTLNNPSFLLIPTPQGQLIPLPRACHRILAGPAGTFPDVRRPPLRPLPSSTSLPTFTPGHVIYSDVSSSAYQFMKVLTLPPPDTGGRLQTALYIATPLPLSPSSTHTSSFSSISSPLSAPASSAIDDAQNKKRARGPSITPSPPSLLQQQQVVVKVIQHAYTWSSLSSSSSSSFPFSHPSTDPPLGELAAAHILAMASANITTTSSSNSTNPRISPVMPVLDALADDTFLYLFFPFASAGDLFDAVAGTEKGMEEGLARSYFTDIVQGLIFLKMHGMTHGDVSLENVVVCEEEEEELKKRGGWTGEEGEEEEEQQEGKKREEGGKKVCRLIDLEMARFWPQEVVRAAHGRATVGLRSADGKRGYMSPECADGRVGDWLAADIWSLGICLYTMLTRHPLYLDPGEVVFGLLRQGEAGRVIEFYSTEHGLGLSAAAADLIEWMLNPRPEERPTLEQVLEHAWVKGEGGGRRLVVEEEGVVEMVEEEEEEEEEGGGRRNVQPSSPVAWVGVEEALAVFLGSPETSYGSIDSVHSIDSAGGEGEGRVVSEGYEVCGCCQICLADTNVVSGQ